jgi:hypothetical protein
VADKVPLHRGLGVGTVVDLTNDNDQDPEVPMKEWELEDARKHLDAVAHLAVTKGPQRIANGREAVVVLDAGEYDRIIRGIEPTEPPYDERGGPMNLVEFMQNSPLAEAFRDGAFTEEEWDAACRMGR